ncbi:MAG TPA: YIP1 family protein [Anaerolineales bacterium]|nr:YIP1 family protein [Anaerolineales bacterium]
MSDTLLMPMESRKRFHFDWVFPALFHPRQTFEKIAAQAGSVWLTPLLILTLAAIGLVLVAGPIKQQIVMNTPPELPPDFQYYSPEMQAQFMQAQAATQSPVFIYVMPALAAIFRVWAGWLLVGGLLHLVLTLLGGRGATSAAMNLVAWSSLPYALLDLVRIAAVLYTKRLIETPGLSGFTPVGVGFFLAFLAVFLAQVDIYLIWQIALLAVGVRVASGLKTSKVVLGVTLVTLLVVVSYAALTGLISSLGGMTIVRPFF